MFSVLTMAPLLSVYSLGNTVDNKVQYSSIGCMFCIETCFPVDVFIRRMKGLNVQIFTGLAPDPIFLQK